MVRFSEYKLLCNLLLTLSKGEKYNPNGVFLAMSLEGLFRGDDDAWL